MSKHFVSEPIEPCDTALPTDEPQLPAAFRWRGQTLEVKGVLNRGRSTKMDRGDTYLKRHWFEVETGDGRIATLYFDRSAKRGTPHWWLYAIEG